MGGTARFILDKDNKRYTKKLTLAQLVLLILFPLYGIEIGKLLNNLWNIMSY